MKLAGPKAPWRGGDDGGGGGRGVRQQRRRREDAPGRYGLVGAAAGADFLSADLGCETGASSSLSELSDSCV